MKTRMNYYAKAPELLKQMTALNTAVEQSGLDHKIIHLVRLRASQINGCAFCVDMHVKEGRRDGETEQRLHLVSAWRESPLFTDRERAALEWTEALTLVADTHVADEIYERVAAHFKEAELVALTFAVVVINSWNRLSISFRPLVGTYQPAAVAAV